MHRPRKKHIWCDGCKEKVSHLWNLRCFDGTEGKEIMRCELCCMTDMGERLRRIYAEQSSQVSA